ncbi:MAG: hypothetical protein AB1599_10935, partial [Planctomycetota bacterium]
MNTSSRIRFWMLLSNLWLIGGGAWAYQWPVSPFAGPHPISATMGEWRDNPPHLHAGVDIAREAGINVYPSVTGSIPNPARERPEDPLPADVYQNGHYLKVGDLDYVHIVPDQSIIDWLRENEGQDYPVTAGITLLGTIQAMDAAHLHLEEANGGANPLRMGGLDNYEDTGRAYVYTLEFVREGTETILTDRIYGKMDILSRAKDSQSNGSATVSVHRIGYQVKNSQDTIVLGPLYNLQFDSTVGGSRGWVYANFGDRQSNLSTYYYWVTNTQSEGRYWNTRLKTGQLWNGADAVLNSEAAYPDGRYKVSTLAFDIRGNGGNLDTSEGAMTVDIDVDNFRPFLERAEIRNSDGVTKYLHTWNLNGTALEKSGPAPNEALGDGTYTINLRFSEPVVNPTVAINTYEGTLTLASSDPAGNQKNFSANFSVGNNSPQEGLRTMTVNAADLAGNALLLLPVTKTTINPGSEITRNSEGTMQGTPGSASVD